jgi:hypothetical protein
MLTSLSLSSTYQAWSSIMLASHGVGRPSFTKLPDLEDTMRIMPYHQYSSLESRAYAIAPVPTLQVGSGESRITWEGSGVAWTMVDLGEDSGSARKTKDDRYFSMLQDGWIPDDGIELFQQFLAHLTARWSELCSQFEDYLSRLVSQH